MFPYQELLEKLHLDIANAGYNPGELPKPHEAKDVTQCRLSSLLQSFYKKLVPTGHSPEADRKALELFKQLNESIPDGDFVFTGDSEKEFTIWDYFRDNFQKCLTPGDVDFDLAYMRETFTPGPGAALGCDSESFYSKLFDSKLTATSDYLVSLYRGAISESDTWALAEMRRFQKFGFEVVQGNRLFFVLKTTEISRTCCTEPAINMMLQQAFGSYLEYCLFKSFGIRLATQADYNRDMSRRGSIDGTLGTIDLKSASDSIRWSLVRRISPNGLLGYFKHFRSPSTILPDGSTMDLRMISTMGNGFTFPLQTIIFACAVRAVYQWHGLPSNCNKTQFGVFGDDIICNTKCYDDLIILLTKLGFTVNVDKSFNKGPFRESCGYDWYAGHFVRGVYIRSLETPQDVCSAVNRLNRWVAMSKIRLNHTIRFLLDRATGSPYVPFHFPVDSGLQTPFAFAQTEHNRLGYLVRYYRPKPKRVIVPLDKRESQTRYKDFNPYGWEVAFLGGYARNKVSPIRVHPKKGKQVRREKVPESFMTVRRPSGRTLYKVASTSVPFWDWEGPVVNPIRQSEDPYKRDPLTDEWRNHYSFEEWKSLVAVQV